MDVKVVQATGFENDAVLSMRVGATRRQGPLHTSHQFSFPAPSPSSSSSSTCKLDVFKPISSSPVNIYRAPQTAPRSDTYSVLFPTPPGTAPKALTLSVAWGSTSKTPGTICQKNDDVVHALAEDWPTPAEVEKIASEELGHGEQNSKRETANEARAYLSRFKLLSLIQELLAQLLRQRPPDPFAFLAAEFQKLAGKPRAGVSGDPRAADGADAGQAGFNMERTRSSTDGMLPQIRDSSETPVILPEPHQEPQPDHHSPSSKAAPQPAASTEAAAAKEKEQREAASALVARKASDAAAMVLQNARLKAENKRLWDELRRLQEKCKEHGVEELASQIPELTSGDPVAATAILSENDEVSDMNRQLRVEHEELRQKLSGLAIAFAKHIGGASTEKKTVLPILPIVEVPDPHGDGIEEDEEEAPPPIKDVTRRLSRMKSAPAKPFDRSFSEKSVGSSKNSEEPKEVMKTRSMQPQFGMKLLDSGERLLVDNVKRTSTLVKSRTSALVIAKDVAEVRRQSVLNAVGVNGLSRKDDRRQSLMNWRDKQLQSSHCLNVPETVEDEPAPNWDSNDVVEVSDGEEELDEPPKTITRQRGMGVSAEAFGAWNNRRAAFVPQNYEKTEEQTNCIIASFRACRLFDNVEDEVITKAVVGMPILNFEAGKRIIKQGDSGDSLFIVCGGNLECFVEATGIKEKLICTFQRGRMFGEIAMLYNTPRKLSVYASDGGRVSVAVLSRSLYQNLIVRHQMKARERREECLCNSRFLDALTRDQIACLADALLKTVYEVGDVIVQQGEPGDDFFIVQEGECAAFVETGVGEDGEVDVQEHRRYEAGDLFGERALLSRTVRAATVTAVGAGGAQVLSMSRTAFERLLGPLSLIQEQHYKTDPRKRIADFYRSGDEHGMRGMRVSDPTFDPENVPDEKRSDWFAVYRPTSRDAIAKMLSGQAVGKGLNVKGKSAKRGRNSGYVPFLQISSNSDKALLAAPRPEARIAIFYTSDDAREYMLTVFEPFLDPEDGVEIHGDRVIDYIDGYPGVFGLELPETVLREVYLDCRDISPLIGWESGRKSEPAFMDMVFQGLRANSEPKTVLYQADATDCMNPCGLLIAYAETTVKPVVSDFDTFLVGSRGYEYADLSSDQVDILEWTLDGVEKILEAPGPGSWTSRWLEIVQKAKQNGFRPNVPPYGFGDAVSYKLIMEVIQSTSETGAVRHGAECFNYLFPQDLDEEYLIVWDRFTEADWQYLNEDELKDFLISRANEGYIFPLNPVWLVRDIDWFDVYEALKEQDEGYKMLCRYFPEDRNIMQRIEDMHDLYPECFLPHATGESMGCAVSRKSLALDMEASERVALALNEDDQPIKKRRQSVQEADAYVAMHLETMPTDEPTETQIPYTGILAKKTKSVHRQASGHRKTVVLEPWELEKRIKGMDAIAEIVDDATAVSSDEKKRSSAEAMKRMSSAKERRSARVGVGGTFLSSAEPSAEHHRSSAISTRVSSTRFSEAPDRRSAIAEGSFLTTSRKASHEDRRSAGFILPVNDVFAEVDVTEANRTSEDGVDSETFQSLRQDPDGDLTHTCSCGAELMPGVAFCSSCGKGVHEVQSAKACICGNRLAADMLFCPRCGRRVQESGSNHLGIGNHDYNLLGTTDSPSRPSSRPPSRPSSRSASINNLQINEQEEKMIRTASKLSSCGSALAEREAGFDSHRKNSSSGAPQEKRDMPQLPHRSRVLSTCGLALAEREVAERTLPVLEEKPDPTRRIPSKNPADKDVAARRKFPERQTSRQFGKTKSGKLRDNT